MGDVSEHARQITAVDPLLASANAANPQTFNRYIYTGNNPINYTDPSGLTWCRNSSGLTQWQGQQGSQCKDGFANIDRTDGVVTGGSFTRFSVNGSAGVGSVITFNANGTVTVLDPSVPGEAARIANATGAQNQATQQEIISTPRGRGKRYNNAARIT